MNSETLIRLIKEASTLRQVQSFLRDRGLPFSAASWDTLIDDRLRPALRDAAVLNDLVQLLCEAEEYGRQHIFLFQRRRSGGRSLPARQQISAWVKGTPDEELLQAPKLLEYPEAPTLAAIRLESDASVSLKVVETRTLVELVGEHERPNGNFVREYSRQPVRAVNVVRLGADGLLEMRIYSHRGRTGTYAEDIPMMWGLIAGLIDANDFTEWPLLNAKQLLWQQRKTMNKKVRFSRSSLRGRSGTTMDCSTGSSDASLFDDDAAEAGLSIFHATGRAYCDRHNIWWLQGAAGVPSHDVHVLLGGMPNEFAVTMQCTRADYEYVLAELRSLNH